MQAHALDTMTALRGQIGLLLVGLARAADWQPFVICLLFVVPTLILLVGARALRRKLEARQVPWGAAYLSSALFVGAPLLALVILDHALAALDLPTLERRILEIFSPALLVQNNNGPVGPDLILATLPAAASLVLVGNAAVWLYFALYARGGLFVWGEGAEANGLMRLAGHWGNRGAEKRCGLWALTVAKAIWGITP